MKPKVAFFDFTGCEGCQLNKLNFENELLDLLAHVDLVEFREAMDETSDEYDITFVEGSITTPACVERIHDIRRRTKVLVALGACAVNGGINAMKNIQPIDAVREAVYGKDKYRFATLPAMPVSAIVAVDHEVRGCPMSQPDFLQLFKALVMGKKPPTYNYAVCVECKLSENECLLTKGQVCLGPVTRAGCEAICPGVGQACIGCRGFIEDMNQEAMLNILTEKGLSVDEARKRLQLFNAYEVAV
ncbi:MAG: NADH:ubiquinone oxidoreductase [Candidatus Marinimicrobia bacterium]|nr:NADH:ubiquinone oxidoreductase [Candidatus Neomarinimicrobiota bacterium]MCF7840908.1 NADH:ubiquinone oxidoreductase [Candidatus Neomarinimicrobiota bacterium]MCF7902318.1 NADH:ubiquinone oxidoreductase [Candidatus Neomarinimicrobiota bacterium]